MIEWTPAISTGVPLLDEQHREIFKWLAELENAAADQRTLFGVYALTRLKQYTRTHFAAEESLMKSAAYPDVIEHIKEHEAFRARLDELQVRCIGQDISSDMVEFLTGWLAHHTSQVDMAYVPFLNTLKHPEC